MFDQNTTSNLNLFDLRISIADTITALEEEPYKLDSFVSAINF